LDKIQQLAEQVRKSPALASREVRNEAIRLEYWERIRNGEGYCQAADNTANHFGVDSKTVYRVRELTTKTVGKKN
jgi:hypothetical protein